MKFDETIEAEELCEPEELDRLRGYLDKQLSHLQGVVARLANRLQRRLMAQQNRAWEFDLEEGVLDPARLSRIIVDPMHPLSFKHEKDTTFRDTVVTLLLDIPAQCADARLRLQPLVPIFWRARLNAVGKSKFRFHHACVEGRTGARGLARSWKNPNPGRSTTCATSSINPPTHHGGAQDLGLMMREGLLKENIDGEALDWAHKRLLGRPNNARY
jgi:cobaltochelatase CobT